ncbi:MAG: type I phosphomannose isomerase catalytic subunit [Planctomycetaceae bacterium]
MQLLKFHPILKHALWGGRRLGSVLNKPLGPDIDYAESWDVSDLPGDVSIVSRCRLTGTSLRQLVESDPQALLGCQARSGRFPLLIKFLDASKRLSIQVHPSAAMAGRRPEVTTGKAETWVVLQADPGSRVYAGLKPGVDAQTLRDAARGPEIVDCLHSYTVQKGDCISLLPGTVHAIGEGLLLAEVQEPNNVTYRLSDWGRLDANGRPRELHLDLALEATNFNLGPVNPVTPLIVEGDESHQRLVATQHFVVDRHLGAKTWAPAEDNRPHVLIQLAGYSTVTTRDDECSLQLGETVVLPASRPEATVMSDESSILLDCWVDELRIGG